MKPAWSPVKELAVERGMDVYQPASMRTQEASETLRTLEPDVLAVVAYGKILPDEVLAIPRLGSVNVHGSLLPKYRGAAPIQWAVLNGDEKSGVTTMYLAHDMDAGDIIYTGGDAHRRVRDGGRVSTPGGHGRKAACPHPCTISRPGPHPGRLSRTSRPAT